MMRPLIIDDAAKAKVARVLEHAEANPYHFRGPVPGDDPRFVAELNTYRAVFTLSHDPEGKVWRHLSISVPSKNYPNPVAVLTIAELFGFTGWDGRTIDQLPLDWILDVKTQEHCVVVMQERKQ
jgi:hypothetical protein